MKYVNCAMQGMSVPCSTWLALHCCWPACVLSATWPWLNLCCTWIQENGSTEWPCPVQCGASPAFSVSPWVNKILDTPHRATMFQLDTLYWKWDEVSSPRFQIFDASLVFFLIPCSPAHQYSSYYGSHLPGRVPPLSSHAHLSGRSDQVSLAEKPRPRQLQ